MRASVPFGTYVVDSDDPDPDIAVVVNRPGVEAQDWDTQRGDSTVALDNPQYSPDSEILVVVFWSDLEAWNPDWEELEMTDLSLETLASEGVPFYAFPSDRLERAPDEMVQQTIDATPETEALLEKLEGGGIDCELEDEETIVCTKFGETYRLRPGELLSGSGVIAAQLESMAKDVAEC
jgi:hypothetical protein